jgi:hypothetical protein
MNSFLKGFFSLFDWMSPKNLDDSLYDLEISDSDMDCFYTNRNVAIVLNKLEKEWHEKVS